MEQDLRPDGSVLAENAVSKLWLPLLCCLESIAQVAHIKSSLWLLKAMYRGVRQSTRGPEIPCTTQENMSVSRPWNTEEREDEGRLTRGRLRSQTRGGLARNAVWPDVWYSTSVCFLIGIVFHEHRLGKVALLVLCGGLRRRGRVHATLEKERVTASQEVDGEGGWEMSG